MVNAAGYRPWRRRIELRAAGSYVLQMARRLSLIEFPADDPDRARRFWSELLGSRLEPRSDGQGAGWQTAEEGPAVGVHERGRGPGDSFSLPYLAVSDIDAALEQVKALGGSVIHPGAQWAICKDSEGSPFALAHQADADADADAADPSDAH
jgi:predicted enzyme related to lactoylglutathione lyase